MILYVTVRYCTCTVLYGTVRCGTVWYCTVRCSIQTVLVFEWSGTAIQTIRDYHSGRRYKDRLDLSRLTGPTIYCSVMLVVVLLGEDRRTI